MSKELMLVDENDIVKGYGEKLNVHRKGMLHRAFSVFIINENNEILIQRRAEGKYHSGGVWSNSCCSHQYRDESMTDAVTRCVMDELGIRISINGDNFYEAGSFKYYSDLGEMKEHEIDHVLIFKINSDVAFNINLDEVSEVRWLSKESINKELEEGIVYSSWFNKAYEIAISGIGA